MAGHGTITLAMLEAAWDHVRTRSSAPGVDGASLADFEADLTAQLAQLLADLRRGVYRAQGLRALWLPKRDGGRRRVVIATVRDRVAQTAAVQWLHPRIEPRLHPSCFAYRLGIGVQDALRAVAAARDKGLRRVARVMERYGTRAQKSVFECWLDAAHLRRMLEAARAEMHPSQDSLRLYRLCQNCREQSEAHGGTPIHAVQQFYIS